jgi:4'-phosphopantetheinyl transferase
MDVYWLEQTEADVPRENDWLAPREAAFQLGLRYAGRRATWRLGRWTAKRALAICFNLPESPAELAKIEVRRAPSGAPEVFLENKLAAVTISLSHRNGGAICAVALPAVELGCDLELIEPHSDAFIADYFAAEEQSRVAQQSAADRPGLLALLWSGKESALKALRAGLRLDTRSVIVDLVDMSTDVKCWRPLQVRYTGGKIFDGWWQVADRMVRTVVAAPPPAPPISLKFVTHGSDRFQIFAPYVPRCAQTLRRLGEVVDLQTRCRVHAEAVSTADL